MTASASRAIRPPDQQYVPAFDGLRALCIFAVMMLHLASNQTSGVMHEIVRRGWYGVDVFFVLSGFLITRIVAGELATTGTIALPRFYLRRALRLQPAFFTALSLAVLFRLANGRSEFYSQLSTLPFFLTYTLNMALAFGWVPLGVGLLQAWSLCIEEQFYFFWPWTLRKLNRRGAIKFTAVAVIAIGIYRAALFLVLNWGHLGTPSEYSNNRIAFGTDTRVDAILIGCLLALLMSSNRLAEVRKKIERLPGLAACTLIIVAICVAWASGGSPSEASWRIALGGSTLMNTVTAAFVAAIVVDNRSFLTRALSARPLVYVGKISYGFYLFHTGVIKLFFRLRHIGPHDQVSLPFLLWEVVAVFSLTVLISGLHYRFVEQYFLSRRDRIGKWIAGSRVAAKRSVVNEASAAPADSSVS